MNRILLLAFCIGFSFFVSAQGPKAKQISVANASFSTDTTKPAIASGFYVVTEDPHTNIKRRLYSFLKDRVFDTDEYYLDPTNVIPFTAIDSVSWHEDTLFRTGFYVLNFRLNAAGAEHMAHLSTNANKLRLSTAHGLRLGTVANNTLVQVVNVADSIPGGQMELSYMYSQADVENLKRNFDKAIAAAKGDK